MSDIKMPRGATKAPTRAELENYRYVYQPYPSTRYHPDGRSITVADEDADAELPKEWRDTPYPPKPAPVVVPAATIAELTAAHAAKISMFDESWAKKVKELELAQKELDLAQAEVADLRSQLAAARKKPQVVVPTLKPASPIEAPKAQPPRVGDPGGAALEPPPPAAAK